MMSLLKSPLRKVVPTTCVALALALIATGSLTAPVSAQIGENVRNGDFSAGTDQWFTTGNLTPTIVDGRLCVDVPGGTVNPWDAIVGQNDIALVQGVSYTYSYELSSNVDEKNRERSSVWRSTRSTPTSPPTSCSRRPLLRRATRSSRRRRPISGRLRSRSAARPIPGRSASTTSRSSAVARTSATATSRPGRISGSRRAT